MYRAVALLLLTSLVVGCQSRSTPAGPSSERPVAGVVAGAVPQAMTGETIPWSCLVASLDRSVFGIFSSARVPCPTPAIGGLSILTGAAAFVPTSALNLTSSVSGSTVALFWSAPTSSDPASSYIVEAGSASGRADLASFDTGSPATTLTVPDVPPGTYFVRVRSRNSAGVGAPSNETVLSVGGGGSCGSVPNPPTTLSASASGATVTLSWATPASGCPPAAYFIEAGSSPGLIDLASFSTGNPLTTFSADGVGNGVYFVRVRSLTPAGKSAASNEATLIVGSTTDRGCLGAPTGLSGSFTGNTISVTWQPGAGAPSSYVVEVGRASGASDVSVADTGNLLRIFSITVPTGTYYFRVKAKSGCGTSVASNEVTVTTTNPTNPPTSPSPPPPPLPSPPPPGPVSLTGTWNGTGNDSQGGTTVTWVLTQAGTTVSGTVRTQAANPSDGSCSSCHRNKSGTFSATIAGTTLTMRMFFAAGGSGDPTPACSATLTGTASPIASDSFTTVYSGADTCEGAFNSGILTMARRP